MLLISVDYPKNYEKLIKELSKTQPKGNLEGNITRIAESLEQEARLAVEELFASGKVNKVICTMLREEL